MTDIRQFPLTALPDRGANAQPVDDVIRMLEEYLAEAKRGELQAIGVAGVRPNGVTTYGFSGSRVAHDLAAAALDLLHEIAVARSELRAGTNSG